MRVSTIPDASTQRVFRGVQWVIHEGEPVVAPDRVVPIFDRRGVAYAGDRPVIRCAVPLVREDPHAFGDVEERVRADHGLAGRCHAGFEGSTAEVAHPACDLANPISAVHREQCRTDSAVGNLAGSVRPIGFDVCDRLVDGGRDAIGRRGDRPRGPGARFDSLVADVHGFIADGVSPWHRPTPHGQVDRRVVLADIVLVLVSIETPAGCGRVAGIVISARGPRASECRRQRERAYRKREDDSLYLEAQP